MKNNRVVELFAGVGGFRVGLNDVKLVDNKVLEGKKWDFVFSNQWEPSTVVQHAYNCYKARFGENKIEELRDYENFDITKVPSSIIPDHDLLVGGFPCQDYSVARSLKNEGGIRGQKGVLWWEINRIMKDKKPNFILLENVDRLLISPSKQRGRDFGIMLRSFNDAGYNVEWRVINAAEYHMPQRRRRVFIFAYRKNSNYNKSIKGIKPLDIINNCGVMQRGFPTDEQNNKEVKYINIKKDFKDIVDVSDNLVFRFLNSGSMVNGNVCTLKSKPIVNEIMPIRDLVQIGVDEKFFLSKEIKLKFDTLRGAKSIERKTKDGIKYKYSEGSMSPFDSLDLPARTMLTSEGSVNRSTHIIKDIQKNKLRFITAVEAERFNMFPDNWTNVNNISDRQRCFLMGNALVTGIVSILSDIIRDIND